MGSMTSPASASLKEILRRLDERIQRVDEERWLSSRYASQTDREALIVLYAFYYELARVRVAVTDATLGEIRFQWWRDALAELGVGEVRQHDVVLALQHVLSQRFFEIEDLLPLIEGHAAAFQTDDRMLEPENQLAMLAAKSLGYGLNADLIADAATEWAGLRRGDKPEPDLRNLRVPSNSRPALAHLRLRHLWRAGKTPGPLSRRLCVLTAMVSGSV